MMVKRCLLRRFRHQPLLKLFAIFTVGVSVYMLAQFYYLTRENDLKKTRDFLLGKLDPLRSHIVDNQQQLRQLQDTVQKLSSSAVADDVDSRHQTPIYHSAVVDAPLGGIEAPEIHNAPSQSPAGSREATSRDQGAAAEGQEAALRGREAAVGGQEASFNQHRDGVSPAVKGLDALRGHCQFANARRAPIDVNMLELYRAESFENPDGGVWKQGWPIEYSAAQWTKQEPLRVIVVPHSHNDPGWIKTFEQYFRSQTRDIFYSMLDAMERHEKMTFIWSEISYLDLWWKEASDKDRERFKRLLSSGRLEIVNGGWVMPDEANSHMYSLLEQLTSGHEWLSLHMNATVRSGWSIDPFGLSPSQAFVLKRSGLHQLVIQRAHYRVKRKLAQNRQLEFVWRQSWDLSNSTDIFCHMMPFFIYDIPHTCGPDPKVCCQFDFLRMPGGRGSCPWRVAPAPINAKNIRNKAELLLDQYRKKAQLFPTNVLLVPLGDDFRYDSLQEWTVQYTNYQKLFDYLNSHTEFNVQVKFGTLSEYFSMVDSVSQHDINSHAVKPTSIGSNLRSGMFSSLSGDFFTYADKNDEYWSGYYTSRPFYKRMDRTLISYLRAAELMFSLYLSKLGVNDVIDADGADWSIRVTSQSVVNSLMTDLVHARRWLSLFQHHDGVTGTSKTFVMNDYGRKLVSALHHCQRVLEVCASALVLPAHVNSPGASLFTSDQLFPDSGDEPAQLKLLNLPADGAGVVVTLFNSLTRRRHETATLLVNSAHVEVVELVSGRVVSSQTSPRFDSIHTPSNGVFQLMFVANLAPYSLTSFRVRATQPGQNREHHLCDVTLMNAHGNVIYNGPHIVQASPATSVTLQSPHLSAEFSSHGLLTSVTVNGQSRTDVRVEFVVYNARRGNDMSGAYLFIPNGPAVPIEPANWPIRVIRGPISSEVTVLVANEVLHTVSLAHAENLDNGCWLHIENVDQIRRDRGNRELAMRLSTSVNSRDRFIGDLNAYQTIERHRFDKLPIQANVYPMPKMVGVEDKSQRVSLVTAQPLGCTSLSSGQLEVVLDRRLMQDDNRGVGQPVTDNILTTNTFRLIVEHFPPHQTVPEVPLISLLAQLSYQSLHNQPFYLLPSVDAGKFVVPPNKHQVAPLVQATPTAASSLAACDLELITLRRAPLLLADRSEVGVASEAAQPAYGISGISLATLQHVAIDCRLSLPQQWLPVDDKSSGVCRISNGKVALTDILPGMSPRTKLQSALLTGFADSDDGVDLLSAEDALRIPPMEISAYRIYHRLR